MQNSPTLIEVFAGSLWEASMVKNLLENENIRVFLKDEITGSRSPLWTPEAGVKVMVSSQDKNKAIEIVKDYESNLK